MILVVGLSPAWQQILVLDQLSVGEVNRAKEVHRCASGKVINVAVALAHLDAPHEMVTVTGGPVAEEIRRELGMLSVRARLLDSASATRVCTTLLDRRDGRCTELVENAEPIESAVVKAFCDVVGQQASLANVAVFTGSMPPGVPDSLLARWLEEQETRWILDIRGAPLMDALARHPFVVKPNREELAMTIGSPLSDDRSLVAAMRELNRRGAQWVVVTDGPRAVWATSATEVFRAQPPKLRARNPIGSGDCFTAGLSTRLDVGEVLPDAIPFAIAAAAANARQLLPARIDRQEVSEMAKGIAVRRVNEQDLTS